MLKLWGRSNSINVQKPMFALAELGLAYERVDAGLSFGIVGTPEYRALNPNGAIPTLEHDDFVVWESNTIVRYLAATFGDEHFWPADPRARARQDMWMDWQQTVLNWPVTICFWGLVRFPGGKTPEEIEAARKQAEAAVDLLEAWLVERSYVAGERFGMADCVLAPTLHRWLHMPCERQRRPHLERYHARVMERDSAKEILTLPLT